MTTARQKLRTQLLPFTWVAGCLLCWLFSACTAEKAQFNNFSERNDFSAAVTYKKEAIKKQVIPILPDVGEQCYFALLNETIYFIGKINSNDSSGMYLRKVQSGKELNRLADMVKHQWKVTTGNVTASPDMAIQQGFKKISFASTAEQYQLVDVMKELTAGDERERGCYIRMTESATAFHIYMEPVFTVGLKDEVKFRFPVRPNGAISLREKNGDMLIGTVHTHTHDKGLSGLSREEKAEGKGDIANVLLTGVPWIAIGPSAIEAGYLNKYGTVLLDDITEESFAMYALWKIAQEI